MEIVEIKKRRYYLVEYHWNGEDASFTRHDHRFTITFKRGENEERVTLEAKDELDAYRRFMEEHGG